VPDDSRVRPDRIRAIAGLPRGETFSPQALERAAERLRRSGAFSSVALREAEAPGPAGRLDIRAAVTDAKPRRIGFGAELASLEGVTLTGFWLHRNLLGGAERFRVDGRIGGIGGESGGIDYALSSRFERPATFTPDTGLYLEARLKQEDEPDYRERSAQLEGGLTHVFSERLKGEAGLAYRYAEIDDDLGSRTLQHVLVPLELTWDSRDDTLDATDGWYLDLEATPFVGLDRSAAGARAYADARGYLAFGKEEGLVLAGRAQLGTVAGAKIAEIPAEMLFYSGGAGTVRGQPFQSLAVDLGGGRRVGGRSFMAFSGELRADVGERLGLVAFADTGFVGQDSLGTDNGSWHSGAGFGVRYDTGVGPIRLDIATPLDGDPGEDFELYIGIGQAF
jgi:translocation and assembly module TamA